VWADRESSGSRRALGAALPEGPATLGAVIDEIVSAVEPGLMGSAGPRYFGFVVGGSLDAALVADLLTGGWDQVVFNEATSPAALAVEDVAGSWLDEHLDAVFEKPCRPGPERLRADPAGVTAGPVRMATA
jgi:hypothetical protein